MEKPFHPNDIDHPNYKQMLQEHYKRVNKRLGVAAIPRVGVSRLEMELSTIVDTKPILPVISIVVPEVEPTPKMTKEEKEVIRQGKYLLLMNIICLCLQKLFFPYYVKRLIHLITK